ISTIYNALLTDPMSDYVTLDQSSIKYSALLLSQNTHTLTEIPSTATDFPDFAKGITSTVTAGQIQLDHLNLGLDKNNNRQGYRITYNVTLKEAYRDGKFYPTNQTTYLANGNSTNKYYAVPSVKVPLPKVDFNLTKIAAGTQTGLAGAKFQLFDAETGGTAKSDEVTSGTNGELKFTGITPGTYWLRETVTPEGFQTMKPIQITVDRQGKVTGEGITDGKISNTLKKIDLTLNKKGQDGNALAGAVFELKQGDTKYPLTEANGVHTLKNLSPGTYEVIETSAPAGYRLLGTIGTLTVTNIGGITFEPTAGGTGNNFTVDKKGENIQIKMDVNNQLKPFELGLTKRDAHDAELFLQGAVFTLYDKVPTDTTANELATLTTDANGKGQFKKTDGTVYLLEAGKEYYFKETTAPSGYLLSTSIFKVSVGTDGSVTVEKDDEKIDSTTTLEADKNNQIGLMVDNDPKAPLPETGGIGRLVWLLTGLILIGLTAVYLLKARFTKEVL
ncbi:MAG: SpaA isopeptide-forming pilin-related protein, partial [Enterococcus sp.]|uniref:MSCRAMM family protein n=1 Tax=Enterococcus sp. TaxID=35783 RepID=UPI002FC91177